VDLIHVSGLAGGIKDPNGFVDMTYQSCTGDGWLEISDWWPHIEDCGGKACQGF
jgi:hypothetical protein